MTKLTYPEVVLALAEVKHLSIQMLESSGVGRPDSPELNYTKYINDYLNLLRVTLTERAAELETRND